MVNLVQDKESISAALVASESRDQDMPVWSPDGKSLAYVREVINAPNEIMVRNLDSLVPVLVARADARSVFWSADGTRLNYVTNTGVRSMSRAGGEATLVLKGDYGDAAPSPDGKALVLWLNKGEKGAKEPKLWISSPPGAPPRKYEPLLLVHLDIEATRGQRAEPEHQALRHGPGLAAQIADLADGDPGLLGYLADHGLLRGFARLHEAGQDGPPPLRPLLVAGQQAPVIGVGHQHDHRWVDPWEVLTAVYRAVPGVARRHRLRQRAAAWAVGMGGVPVGQRDGMCEQAGVAVVQERRRLPQASGPDARLDRRLPAGPAPGQRGGLGRAHV